MSHPPGRADRRLARRSDTVQRFARSWAGPLALTLAGLVWLRSWLGWGALDHGTGFAIDFGAYHAQVVNLFVKRPQIVPAWVYPPAAAIAFLPFRPFSLPVATGMWIFLNLALVGVLVHWGARELRALGRLGALAAATALTALSLPVIHCLKWGQTSLALAVLAVAALRTRTTWGVILLGAAAAVKIYPAGLLLAPIARREWRRAGLALAAAGVIGVLLPLAALGPRLTLAFFAKIVLRFEGARHGNWAHGHSAAWWGGQGWSAALERWFSNGGHVQLEETRAPLLFPLPDSIVTALAIGGAMVVLVATLWTLRNAPATSMRAALLPLAGISLLTVPGWHHYFVFLPLVAATVLGNPGSSTTARGLAWASVLLAAAPLVVLYDLSQAYFRFSQWGGTTMAAIAGWAALLPAPANDQSYL